MRQDIRIPGPEIWVAQLFAARAVRTGGVIRRRRRDIDSHAGWDRLLAEVDRRGFHVIETGDQVLILCNSGHFRVVR